eukprot:6081025-Pleurochrysis_carterae.AAC.1
MFHVRYTAIFESEYVARARIACVDAWVRWRLSAWVQGYMGTWVHGCMGTWDTGTWVHGRGRHSTWPNCVDGYTRSGVYMLHDVCVARASHAP